MNSRLIEVKEDTQGFEGMSYVEPSTALWQEVDAIAGDEGLILYDIERQSQLMRIFVEKPIPDLEENAPVPSPTEGGVQLDDCTRLCRRLMTFFSVEGPALAVGSEPLMEVSSPGVNRHLRLRGHFDAAKGRRVKVHYLAAEGAVVSRAEVKAAVIGVLKDVGEEGIKLVVEPGGEELEIRWSAMIRARCDFDFGHSERK